LVLRSKEALDRLRKLAMLLEQTDQLLVMTANIQPIHSATLEGEEEIILTSKKTIEHHYQNIILELGSKSFFQVTSHVAQNLYQTIAAFLQENAVDSMLDLYCGVGAFSLYAAPYVKRAVGVEISADAISLAKINAGRNQFTHLDYYSTDVNHFWSSLPNDHFDLILVNPPRSGVGEKSINEILKLNPKYIVYSSCNALTLKRDFELINTNYQSIYTRIFDMFPYTSHYETLMIFKKRD
jgi:23S rRNA (uracil747-C5)-methyltransferase